MNPWKERLTNVTEIPTLIRHNLPGQAKLHMAFNKESKLVFGCLVLVARNQEAYIHRRDLYFSDDDIALFGKQTLTCMAL